MMEQCRDETPIIENRVNALLAQGRLGHARGVGARLADQPERELRVISRECRTNVSDDHPCLLVCCPRVPGNCNEGHGRNFGSRSGI
jgi:hypothetical protein